MNLRDLGALYDTSNPPPECVLTQPLEPHLPNLTDYSSIVQALRFDSGSAGNPTARSYVFYFFRGAIDEQRRPDEILTFKVRLDNPFKVHIVDNYLGGMSFGAINAPALAHRYLWRPGLMNQEGKQQLSTPSTASIKKTESKEKQSGSVAASEVAADILKKSTSAATELWNKYGDMITSAVLQVTNEIAKHGKQQIANDEKYQKHVIDTLWKMLPLPVRLLGRKRLRWDAFLFSLRDKIFLIEGKDVRVRPNAKEQITMALRSVLGHHAVSEVSQEEDKEYPISTSIDGDHTGREDGIALIKACVNPDCEEEIPGDSAFCEYCGTKQDIVKPTEDCTHPIHEAEPTSGDNEVALGQIFGVNEAKSTEDSKSSEELGPTANSPPHEIKAPSSQAVGQETHPKIRELLSHLGTGYFKDFEEVGENLYRVTTQLTELFGHDTYFRFEIYSDVLRFEIRHFFGYLNEQSTIHDLIDILKENDRSLGTTSCYACLHPPHPSNGISYVSLQNNHSYLMKWESADIAEMINLQFHDLKMSGYLLLKRDPPIAPAIRVWGPDNPRLIGVSGNTDHHKAFPEEATTARESARMQAHETKSPPSQTAREKPSTAPRPRESGDIKADLKKIAGDTLSQLLKKSETIKNAVQSGKYRKILEDERIKKALSWFRATDERLRIPVYALWTGLLLTIVFGTQLIVLILDGQVIAIVSMVPAFASAVIFGGLFNYGVGYVMRKSWFRKLWSKEVSDDFFDKVLTTIKIIPTLWWWVYCWPAEKLYEKYFYRFSRLAMGISYAEVGRYDKALEELQEARVSRFDKEGQFMLDATKANVYSELGRYDDAIHSYHQALQHGSASDTAGLNADLAYCFMMKGQYNESVKLLREVLVNSPENVNLHLGMARCYINMDMNDDALSYLKDALRLEPQNAATRMMLAEAYFDMGDEVKALKEAELAMTLNPSSDVAEHARHLIGYIQAR